MNPVLEGRTVAWGDGLFTRSCLRGMQKRKDHHALGSDSSFVAVFTALNRVHMQRATVKNNDTRCSEIV